MAQFAGAHVFSFNPDSDLHGRAVGHVQATLEGQQVANVDRAMEIDSVDGGGDHIGAGIPCGNDKGSIIDQLHDDSPVDVAGGIDVVGHHDMGDNGSAEF